MPKPSLFLGPVVVTEMKSARQAPQPAGLVNRQLAARGEALVRVIKDSVEMARNAAEFVKAAAARGLVRIGRTGLETPIKVAKTALMMRAAGDRGEPDYVPPGPSGNRGEHPSWPPAGADGYADDGAPLTPFGPARGPANGIYSLVPRKPKRVSDDSPYDLEVPNADRAPSFVKKYAAGLTEKECATCGAKFMTTAPTRSLCATHAASKASDSKRGA